MLDLRLPHVSGFAVIKELRKERQAARIVVLSNYQGSEDIYRALQAGAMAYLTKDASGEEVISAFRVSIATYDTSRESRWIAWQSACPQPS